MVNLQNITCRFTCRHILRGSISISAHHPRGDMTLVTGGTIPSQPKIRKFGIVCLQTYIVRENAISFSLKAKYRLIIKMVNGQMSILW